MHAGMGQSRIESNQELSGGVSSGNNNALGGQWRDSNLKNGSQRALMLQDQLSEFDGSSKSKPQAMNKAMVPQGNTAPSIVAGLSRPQNAA